MDREFDPLLLNQMRKWWNGRHWGLKILCLRACGFESRLPYQLIIVV